MAFTAYSAIMFGDYVVVIIWTVLFHYLIRYAMSCLENIRLEDLLIGKYSESPKEPTARRRLFDSTTESSSDDELFALNALPPSLASSSEDLSTGICYRDTCLAANCSAAECRDSHEVTEREVTEREASSNEAKEAEEAKDSNEAKEAKDPNEAKEAKWTAVFNNIDYPQEMAITASRMIEERRRALVDRVNNKFALTSEWLKFTKRLALEEKSASNTQRYEAEKQIMNKINSMYLDLRVLLNELHVAVDHLSPDNPLRLTIYEIDMITKRLPDSLREADTKLRKQLTSEYEDLSKKLNSAQQEASDKLTKEREKLLLKMMPYLEHPFFQLDETNPEDWRYLFATESTEV